MQILQQLIKPSYYFNPQPPYIQNEIWFYLILFIVILIGSVVLKQIFTNKSSAQKPYIFFKEQFFNTFVTCAIIGFVLLFLRWQFIYYLSARILIIIDLLIIVVYLIMLAVYLIKKLPVELDKFAKDKHFNKYIPKPRKK